MNNIPCIIELIEGGQMPSKAHPEDAGFDCYARERYFDEFGNICYSLGFRMEFPDGYEAQLRPRSSISKFPLVCANSVGTIDSNFRGELIMKFKPTNFFDREGRVVNFENLVNYLPKEGDRVAQLIFSKLEPIQLKKGKVNTNTNRGEGGYGSTGL